MYPNTFYRVSVKALIKDEKERILIIKENQGTWSLPGGGLDFGEDAIDGVKRELKEELGVDDVKVKDVKCVKTLDFVEKNAWLMWIVYEVELKNTDFKLGEGVTEATETRFIDSDYLANSEDIFEKMVYEVIIGEQGYNELHK
jgi:ADP-ribose pyrophosphatase YjhB (NUDIX family)